MEIDEQVKSFISKIVNVSVDDLRNDLDLERDIDWSRVHPDEYRDFFEDFMHEFGIYHPRSDFNKYVREKNIPWYQFPFAYINFKVSFETRDIENITVGNLIEIAQKKEWDF